MSCFACKVKRENLELQRKIERMETGAEVERLENALEAERKAKLNAVNRADRRTAEVEELQDRLQRAHDVENHLRDQVVWMEEERDKARKELAESKRRDKKVIDRLEKELSTAQWKIERVAADKEKEKKQEIAAIKDEYEKRLEQKEAENAVLRERIKDGEEQKGNSERETGKPKGANSRNSSTPPSQDPTHPTIPNNRTKSGKPQGGQKGHPFHPRKKYVVKEPIVLPDPIEVQKHPEDYYCIGEIRKQKVSVRLVVEVTEYVARKYRHHTTRECLHTEFPEDVGHLEVNYDATVDALTSYLHTVANVPYNKIQEMLKEATDGQLMISVGTLAEREKLFSEMTEEERTKIATELLAGKYMNIDGTMIRSDGKQRQILIMRNKEAVLYKMTGCKGNKSVEGTPAERYQGTVVTDSEATFMKLGSRRQACLIHELRYLVRARENMPELTWHKEMHELMLELIDIQKEEVKAEKAAMAPGKRKLVEERWDAITAKGCEEINRLLPGTFSTVNAGSGPEEGVDQAEHSKKVDGDGKRTKILPNGIDLTKDINLLKRLISRKDECLLFLKDYSIPYHNNDAEKSARTAKTHTKPNGGMRADQYAGYYADAASVLETEQLKGRSRYQKLRSTFGKRVSNAKAKMREALAKHREQKNMLLNRAISEIIFRCLLW